jgi:hypothetical protein
MVYCSTIRSLVGISDFFSSYEEKEGLTLVGHYNSHVLEKELYYQKKPWLET